MDRTKAIFDWIFGMDHDRNHAPYQLSYFASKDVGLTNEALQARQDHEKRSTETIQTKLVPKYTSMKEVWMFINQNHDLYTAEKLIAGATQVTKNNVRNDALKASYGGKLWIRENQNVVLCFWPVYIVIYSWHGCLAIRPFVLLTEAINSRCQRLFELQQETIKTNITW